VAQTMLHSSWFRHVVGGVCGLGIALLSRFLVYGRSPTGYEWPIFFAPIITIWCSSATFLFYVENEEAKRGANASAINVICMLGAMATMFFCCILTFFIGWAFHLIFLLVQFVLFFWWDWEMLKYLPQNSLHRHEIANGNRLVNRPTIIGIFIALLMLLLPFFPAEIDDGSPMPQPNRAKTESKSVVSQEKRDSVSEEQTEETDKSAATNTPMYEAIRPNRVKSAKDVFVAGLVAFHLTVAAAAYVFTRRVAPEDYQAGLRRWLYLVLWELPQGPPGGSSPPTPADGT